ncbi:polycomb group RING finger protein 5-B-like isoform X2 [Xenia sp. Carnegie-2017]|uniref:polycomb group RING finger protein 5-B-like isoform X2 n=1 Tax=Xenia sp. Carnegie-2017 TaxID=2897299 RepID=UPI001F04F834|nr:polycomb group RING finger protein 5-B-like isoform X2 [Xenia sp. Carnegie-2017]
MDLLQSNKTIKLKPRDFNDLLTCYLCKGYWIKPTTVAECLHTFCRSCIVQYLDDTEEIVCPRCFTVIHETNPTEMLRHDQTLEDIIFKLVPHLQENEKQREYEFNRAQKRKKNIETAVDSQPFCKRQKEERKTEQFNDHRNDPQIAFCLDCIDSDEVSCKYFQPLAKKFIKTSIRLTIGHLKKYLRLKLNLPNKKEVDILCNGEIMGKDHTLEFIYMTRWRLKSEHLLTLHYRPQEVILT